MGVHGFMCVGLMLKIWGPCLSEIWGLGDYSDLEPCHQLCLAWYDRINLDKRAA